MTYGEGNDEWIRLNNDLPAKKAALDKIASDANTEKAFKIAAYEASNTAYPRPVTPGFNEYSTIMESTFDDIRLGADVKEALNEAVNRINTAFEKYK